MGILLTFMFLWNMLGALTLAPAIAYFLFPKGKGEADGKCEKEVNGVTEKVVEPVLSPKTMPVNTLTTQKRSTVTILPADYIAAPSE